MSASTAMRFLTGDQALACIVLWGSGRFDTLEIAKLLSVGEDAVCRTLRFARDAADQDARKAVRQ
ncbi:MAG: hypothetical protein ACREDO_04610 [Methyloceanibacter sp.]